jgi:hypothetical protein
MSFAVLSIRRFPVSGLQNRKEIWKEVDQHARQYESPA